ncbi:MAG: endonuclease/exonuclease/phosphatase family protein [Bacteroidota bacterium]
MSYNIRYDNPKDGPNQWSQRKENLAQQILFYEPDFIGIQEALLSQLQFLDTSLEDYEYIGVARDDGKEKGEFSAVFYRKDKFERLTSNTFWLSETPQRPSKSWDAALPRICTYGNFKDEKGRAFWIFNTHFDHRGKEARRRSAQVIIEKIKELNTNQETTFLLGDFNALPEAPPIVEIKKFLQDSYSLKAIKKYGPKGTFNGFQADKVLEDRIDYIFLRAPDFKVKKYAALGGFINGRYLSDHQAIYLEGNWK